MPKHALRILIGILALGSTVPAQTPPAGPANGDNPAPAGGGRGAAAGGGRGGAGAPAVNALVAPMLAQGDRNGDALLDPTEIAGLARDWFEALDSPKSGSLTQAELIARLPGVLAGPAAAGTQAPAAGGAGGRGGGGRGGGGGVGLGLFVSADANADGSLTRAEFTDFFVRWSAAWDAAATGRLGQEQLNAGLVATLPPAGSETADFLKRPSVLRQSPADQQKLFLLPPGFKIEPVLADPDIQDPVAISFDGNGRMYVLEMRSYMRDVDGSNSREPISRISRWESTKGDGVYDKHTVFLDKLVLPRLAHPLGKDSVLVIETDDYDLYKYTDTNGDGVSDKKELFYAGFGRRTNMEWQPGGSLVWALDNWMYSSYNPFRLRIGADGKVVREETAVNGGQWGAAQDNYGKTWFVDGGTEIGPVNFQQPIVYGAFNVDDNFEPGFQIPWGAPIFVADMQGGMNRVRLPDGSLNHFTAAAGPEIYRGHTLPGDLVGDLFFTEPVGRIVRRAKVAVTDGVTQLQNAYPRSEFIRSTDPLFRPVNVSNGPDGSLYVMDMYTGIIQDAQFTGPGSYLRRKAQQYDLDKVANLGRVWRVSHESKRPDATAPRMLDETPAQLVAHLDHPNGWWRDTAQELLVLRQDKSVVPAVTALLRNSASQMGRIHALWTLEGLQALTPALAREAMRNPDPKIRIQAIRASETLYKAGDKSFAEDYRTLAKDADVNVAIQALLTANLLQIPESTALIRATLASNSARGIKEVGNQLLTPGRSMGQPASNDQSVAVLNLTIEQRRAMTQGQAVYREICFSCHGNDGKGSPVAGAADGATLAPALAGSARVTAHRDYVIHVLLKGLTGDLDGKVFNGGGVMVPMGANTDEWIASVASYIRNSFGNTASFVTAEQVAAVRTATIGRTTPWTLAELEPVVPVLLANQSDWKATASVNETAAVNALEAAAPATTVVPAAAPRGGAAAGGGRGGAGAVARWDTGGAQQPGMWFQVELPQAANVTEIQLDAMATGGRGGGRGAAPVGGPAQYRVQVSTDGTTWSQPVAQGSGQSPTTTIAFAPVSAKFIRITQTGSDPAAPTWAIQRLRVYARR
jgi:mono/diheme cytochrome c family protein